MNEEEPVLEPFDLIEEVQEVQGFEVDVKRFYAPFIVHSGCPKCKKPHKKDLSTDYLSYPTLGKPERVGFHCEDCEHEWEKRVVLGLTLRFAENKKGRGR